MTVSWILERDVFAEVCFDQMVEHFKARDIPHAVVRIIPFIHEIEGRKPKLTGPIVVYGSIGVQKLARAEGWAPGVFTDPETLNYEAYADALGDLLLNVDCTRMPLSAVSAYLADRPFSMPEFFIKPNADTKEFAGTVMTNDEFDAWHKNMMSIGYLETDDFDVVISPVKKLGCEWRIVVVDGKISDSSIYRQYGIVKPERHIIPEVEEVVMAAHAKFQPAPVYVIDVCQVEIAGDLKYKVIEYNTFNSAGLYACDVKRIIDDINAYVERVS
jgi:hypothetical protein